jgi:hypothetical protein
VIVERAATRRQPGGALKAHSELAHRGQRRIL